MTNTEQWRKFDPRNGNYDDCNASVELQRAEEWLGVDFEHERILGWRKVGCDTVQFLIQDERDNQVWTITTDHDADGDSEGWRDLSKVTDVRIECTDEEPDNV